MASTIDSQAAPTERPAIDKAPGLLRGVWAPALTPLNADLAPDTAKALAYYRWLLDHGCHGIAFMGTNSEATSFSVGERMALLDAALEAGIAPAELLVGSGCAALTDTVELTRHATANGCAVLMLPPFYYKQVREEGLYRAFAEVVDRVGGEVKLYFYNFPKLSGIPITHAVMRRLIDAYGQAICGVKDSTGDAASTSAYIAEFPDLSIFPGTEKLQLEMLRKGGAGTITAGANISPGPIRAVFDAHEKGDAEADALQAKVDAVRDALAGMPMIEAAKAVLATALGDGDWRAVRPPLTEFTPNEANDAAARLAAAGYKFTP
jgi:4-hydroxy-tetrahydrodipicolinate synthase